MDLSELVILFRKVSLFHDLDAEIVISMAGASEKRFCKNGEVIVPEGVLGREFFLIGAGRVEVVKGLGSKCETTLATLGTGDVFGEMSVLECRARTASVRTTEPTTLHVLNRADLLRLFDQSPQQFARMMLNLSRDLCHRLRSMDEVFAARSC